MERWQIATLYWLLHSFQAFFLRLTGDCGQIVSRSIDNIGGPFFRSPLIWTRSQNQ
jgi:hypothetical protein